MHVGLPHLERQPLAERGADRHLVEEPAVDAGDRDRAALAAGVIAWRSAVGRSVAMNAAVFDPVVVRVERRRRAPPARRRRCTRRARARRSARFSRSNTSSLSKLIVSARRAAAAIRSRAGTRSIAITRSAPSSKRAADRELPDRAAAPHRDVSPGWMLQFSAAM